MDREKKKQIQTDGQTGTRTDKSSVICLSKNVNVLGLVRASLLTRHIGVIDGVLILKRN